MPKVDLHYHLQDFMPEKHMPLWVVPISAGKHHARSFHDHFHSELVIILSGTGEHLLNGENASVSAGDVLLIHPGVIHAYDKTSDLALVNIIYDARQLYLPVLDGYSLPLFRLFFPEDPRRVSCSALPLMHLDIRYGGTLRVGELAFDDRDANAEDASFRDDESTRRYIDTAICKNIQHSLKCYDNGSRLDWLRGLYEANELTGAINRVIEDANHRFILSILNDDFKSHDLGATASNLRKEKDPTKRTDALDKVDVPTITRKLMELLEIKNKADRKIEINESDIEQIKGYLKALELITDCPTERAQPGLPAEEHILFLQPGMRYCQAQALVHVLLQDEYFMSLDEREKTYIQDRILQEVRGRMLEDIVLIDTAKALKDQPYKVFKLQFTVGEFDMVVYNTREHCCDIYEVKHSEQMVAEQAKHLQDEEKIRLTEKRFGEVKNRCVLYRGTNAENEDGIIYKNVAEYLKGLPDSAMTESIGQDMEEGQGWGPKM